MKTWTALCLATLATATVQAAVDLSTNSTAAGYARLAGKEVAAEPVLTGPEVSIPFINHGGIYDFHAYNDLGIWIQGRDRKWYYGKFFSPCIGIANSITVGFSGGPTDTLDRFGAVYSRETGRCTLTSLRAGEMPPGLEPKKADEKAAAKPDKKPDAKTDAKP
jgi:hypothetical protein